MGKYLAIYNGSATDDDKQEITQENEQAFMTAWAEWAQTNRGALVDPGTPLFRKKRVTGAGVTDFEDGKTGYTIIEATSHDAAVSIFTAHPHLTLLPGNSIEVIECPPIPGQG